MYKVFATQDIRKVGHARVFVGVCVCVSVSVRVCVCVCV